jgi:carbohydrate-selective porin OprB
VLETFYNFQVTPFCSLKPDLQWISNPGGQFDPQAAWLVTLRTTLIF